MMMEKTFDLVIDTVETLPDEQQEILISIIKKRLSEKRREEIAENIYKVKEEYKNGSFSSGNVDDLMKELSVV